MKIGRTLASITDEEIDNIFNISGIPRKDGDAYFQITKLNVKTLVSYDFMIEDIEQNPLLKSVKINIGEEPKENSIVLEDSYNSKIIISEKGIGYKKEFSELEEIPNSFQVAQYLMDQGFRFNYGNF